MKLGITAIAFAAIASLSACSSPRTVSKANFEKVINARLAEHCSTLPLDPTMLIGTKHTDDWYPIAVELPGQSHGYSSFLNDMSDSNKKQQIAMFDVLEKAGVFTSKPTKAQFMDGQPERNGKEYSLTEAGKAARVAPGKWSLCVGTPKVTEVIRYSEPGDVFGQTVSEVTFTYTVVNVPAWAQDKGLLEAMPRLATMLEPNKKANASLLLMSDGWRDSSATR